MNKGLEVIEAHHLFAMPYDKIAVVVQPQSAIHSMVEFTDGSVKAHLGTTDMRIPIQFALSYPARWSAPVEPLDFRTLGSLEFEAPDLETFRCLALAIEAGTTGGTLPAVMNAANEVAVAAFLDEQIPYLGIAELVERTMNHAVRKGSVKEATSIEELLAIDAETRVYARELLKPGDFAKEIKAVTARGFSSDGYHRACSLDASLIRAKFRDRCRETWISHIRFGLPSFARPLISIREGSYE